MCVCCWISIEGQEMSLIIFFSLFVIRLIRTRENVFISCYDQTTRSRQSLLSSSSFSSHSAHMSIIRIDLLLLLLLYTFIHTYNDILLSLSSTDKKRSRWDYLLISFLDLFSIIIEDTHPRWDLVLLFISLIITLKVNFRENKSNLFNS